MVKNGFFVCHIMSNVRAMPLSKRRVAEVLQVLYPLDNMEVLPSSALVTETIAQPFGKSTLKMLVGLAFPPPPTILMVGEGEVGTL